MVSQHVIVRPTVHQACWHRNILIISKRRKHRRVISGAITDRLPPAHELSPSPSFCAARGQARRTKSDAATRWIILSSVL